MTQHLETATADDTITVEQLAAVLGGEPRVDLLAQVLRVIGPERTTELLIATLTCESECGMLTKDRSRRRTPGGAFFQLCRQHLTARERRQVFGTR